MEYVNDLTSGSSPKIKKAAQNIIKKRLTGYCSYLLEALTKEIEKPKAWQTQCHLIRAIGIGSCSEALPFLKKLIERNYENTILYRDLAFSIFLLENTHLDKLDLSFLFESIEKENDLQIGGACSAILYKKIVPKETDIQNIVSGISKFTEDEGKKITPRCYIAAIAHLWPKNEVKDFLESCKESNWPGLVEIAQDALEGKEPRIQLV
ncbi:hypothetical protein [Methylomonas sp. YC3]